MYWFPLRLSSVHVHTAQGFVIRNHVLPTDYNCSLHLFKTLPTKSVLPSLLPLPKFLPRGVKLFAGSRNINCALENMCSNKAKVYLFSLIILKYSKICITTIKQAYSTHITTQRRTLLGSVLS